MPGSISTNEYEFNFWSDYINTCRDEFIFKNKKI